MDNDNIHSAYRGDIFYADLEPVRGSEQGGIRPVLIIQNDIGNRHSPTVIVAAITSRIKHHRLPTHVNLNGMQCGLHNESTIMLEQLRTLDKQRLLGYAGTVGKSKMREVNTALEISIGIKNLLLTIKESEEATMVNQSTEKKNTRQIQMTIEGHKVTVSFAQEANPTLSALVRNTLLDAYIRKNGLCSEEQPA